MDLNTSNQDTALYDIHGLLSIELYIVHVRG